MLEALAYIGMGYGIGWLSLKIMFWLANKF